MMTRRDAIYRGYQLQTFFIIVEMDKFQNKYRIPSSRWQNWDYGSNAAYYVTMCTQHRICYFGDIVHSQGKIMQLSESGKIAKQLWYEIPNHFPFVELDAFVVMPNHVHGIIVINKSGHRNTIQFGRTVETRLIASLQSVRKNNTFPPTTDTPELSTNDIYPNKSISIEPITNSATHGGITGNKNPMIYENLSRVIRWYKGRCSFEIHKITPDFDWQSRFHDHVIRDYMEYTSIRDYINDNPAKWEEDSLFND